MWGGSSQRAQRARRGDAGAIDARARRRARRRAFRASAECTLQKQATYPRRRRPLHCAAS
jgi:hypothetical protein